MTALTQLEVADYALGLRGKIVRAEKLHNDKRAAFCTIIYGLDTADDVVDTGLSSAANGYPDAQVFVDEQTRVKLPWRPGTDAVLGTLATADGEPLAQDPRGLVRSLSARLADRGLTPILGYEYEVHLFDRPAGPQARRAGRVCCPGSGPRGRGVHIRARGVLGRGPGPAGCQKSARL